MDFVKGQTINDLGVRDGRGTRVLASPCETRVQNGEWSFISITFVIHSICIASHYKEVNEAVQILILYIHCSKFISQI